jgi:nucleotide-binding universal stress UspA family protein
MPGIIVGIDGSGHSQRALEWAMNEAALRHVPLTVITVHEVAAGYWGSAISYPDDHALADRARRLAQDEADKVLAGLAGPRPESVTVEAISGVPAEELITSSRNADLIVLASRGVGGFARLLLGSTSSEVACHAHCPVVIIPPEDRR